MTDTTIHNLNERKLNAMNDQIQQITTKKQRSIFTALGTPAEPTPATAVLPGAITEPKLPPYSGD